MVSHRARELLLGKTKTLGISKILKKDIIFE
jgi:hypothetical protein